MRYDDVKTVLSGLDRNGIEYDDKHVSIRDSKVRVYADTLAAKLEFQVTDSHSEKYKWVMFTKRTSRGFEGASVSQCLDNAAAYFEAAHECWSDARKGFGYTPEEDTDGQ